MPNRSLRWNDKPAVREINGRLAALSGFPFQGAVLPLLHLLWPDAHESEPQGTLDAAGIDIYSGSEPHFDLVVQCKGYLKSEPFSNQRSDAIASIRSFEKSGYTTDLYIFLFNRSEHTVKYIEVIQRRLTGLRSTGKARRTLLMEHRELVDDAMNEMERRVLRSIEEGNVTLAEEQRQAEKIIGSEPLREVPMVAHDMKIDARRLRSEGERTANIGDPISLLTDRSRRRIRVLHAPAGFGKTTAAMRAMHDRQARWLLIPAARIRRDMANGHAIFETGIDIERLLADARDQERELRKTMVGPIVKYLTQLPDGVGLIIEALDEAPLLQAQSYDLHRFFNILGNTQAPVMVTVRKEFWESHRNDFDAHFGREAERESTTQTIQIIELKPWENEQIAAAARNHLRTLANADEIARVQRFLSTVESGDYEAFYGDIPRTPIFLKMTLDVMRSDDPQRFGRLRLVELWIRLKILRDVEAPAIHGGGRIPIHPDARSADDTLRIADRAMMAAAQAMSHVEGDRLILDTDAEFDAVRQQMRGDGAIEIPPSPDALMLNTLLVPAASRDLSGGQRVRFAHKMFHEYYVARRLARDSHPLIMPSGVAEWIIEIRRTTS
ncbi:MAG TPA: hypothetical protein VGJ82_20645 [Thermoanaerobaculia bacterium]|jgi:hypothetical protein